MAEQFTPEIMTELRKDIVRVPEIILEASGIKIFGKLIRSIIFTTDIAIIRTKSIIEAADIPVFSGVGGGLTQGARSSYMSMFAEAQGSLGVVLNGPTPLETVKEVCRVVDIPVISTVTSKYTEIDEKLAAGISIINISAGKETAEAVRHFRKKYPELPIIATGGPTEESIAETIQAGANAITYTPPSSGELFSRKMEKYRETEKKNHE